MVFCTVCGDIGWYPLNDVQDSYIACSCNPCSVSDEDFIYMVDLVSAPCPQTIH
jgi:hypothetical protein